MVCSPKYECRGHVRGQEGWRSIRGLAGAYSRRGAGGPSRGQPRWGGATRLGSTAGGKKGQIPPGQVAGLPVDVSTQLLRLAAQVPRLTLPAPGLAEGGALLRNKPVHDPLIPLLFRRIPSESPPPACGVVGYTTSPNGSAYLSTTSSIQIEDPKRGPRAGIY